MNLHAGEMLYHLRYKSIIFMTSPDPTVLGPKDIVRIAWLSKLIPGIHKAKKFIFDSGSDQDLDFVKTVRQTAMNMADVGLFHLPYPVTWIEDPFEEDPETQRNYYLCFENDKDVTLFLFQLVYMKNKKERMFVFYPHPIRVSTIEASDQFTVDGYDEIGNIITKALAEAVYAFKKFIVTLNTANFISEKVTPKTATPTQNSLRDRSYHFDVIRIPFDRSPHNHSDNIRNPMIEGPRRKILVRGFVWGKNTRPMEQQHWVKPYWRSILITKDEEVIEAGNRHYAVKAISPQK